MKNLLLFYFLIFISSCSTDNLSSSDEIDLSKSGSGLASDFIKSFDYMLVNYSDSFPIVQPYMLVSYKDLIFIEDQSLNNIFIVDDKGEVRNIIKNEGAGPKQFQYIDDFQIEENKIIIKDTQLNKFIAFNFNGDFLFEEPASNKALNFFYSDEFKLHFFNNRLNDGEYNFVKEASNGEILSRTYPAKPKYGGNILSLENSFIKDDIEDQLFLNIPFSYDVAFFDFNGNLKKIKTFDFGKSSLTDDFRLIYKNGEFTDDRKSDSYSYVEYISKFFALGDKYYMFIANGKTESHLVSLDREFNVLNQYKKIENDIDGFSLINFPRWQTDDQLIQRLTSNTFLKNYLKNEERMKEQFPNAKIHEFVKKNRYKLERDWLVLIFWNLKK
jgi:hypothetical protein